MSQRIAITTVPMDDSKSESFFSKYFYEIIYKNREFLLTIPCHFPSIPCFQ